MKNFAYYLLFVLCFGSLHLIGAVDSASAQTPSASKQSTKNILAEIVRNKRQKGPFVLLTPKDLAGLVPSELSGLMGGDPCETAVTIAFEQGINGALSTSDCQLDDLTYADFYTFYGVQGEQATVDMGSAAFDSFLGLANETGTFLLGDDDSGGGSNARISTILPETGTYIILANSFFPDQVGSYHLRLSGGPQCTFTFSTPPDTIPSGEGTYTFSLTTQPRCYWESYSSDSYITTNSIGMGSGTVTFSIAPNPSGFRRSGTVSVRNRHYSFWQSGITCIYSLNPTSINLPATETTGSFSVAGTPGCFWDVTALGNFISSYGSGTGNGTVTFTARHNNGSDRVGLIRVGDQMFTINQAGLNCTYSLSPISLNVSALGRKGSVVVNTQPGCTWFISKHVSWLEVQPGMRTGPGTIPYRVLPQTEHASRTGAIIFSAPANSSSNQTAIYVDQSWRYYPIPYDFDADGNSDLSVRRPSDGIWYILRGEAGYMGMAFGEPGDVMVPADYDGDGKTDVAMFRPSNSTWYIFNSESQSFVTYNWGGVGDIPVPADHDGDGKADLVIFRPSTGEWYTRFSNGTFATATFGVAGDKPVVGDFDGDGKSDIAVHRPSDGNWHILKTGFGYFVQTWGVAGDIAVPADYDGDGSTDVAVWRPSTGVWYRIRSRDGFDVSPAWGVEGDVPIPADYDGDGRSDIAVFRPSNGTWYIIGTTGGQLIQNFGQSGDVPTQSSFIY